MKFIISSDTAVYLQRYSFVPSTVSPDVNECNVLNAFIIYAYTRIDYIKFKPLVVVLLLKYLLTLVVE